MYKFMYGVILQFKLDIRNKNMLVTCYLVPLVFLMIMGQIFTSTNPESKQTLIQTMSIMGISMGAIIGLPPSILEMYGTDIKKMYSSNGIPLYFGVMTLVVSVFIHLLILSGIVYVISSLVFDATQPTNLTLYFLSVILLIIVSISVACVIGLSVKNQSKLVMLSQIIFLPSIMLSGIMFDVSLLPKSLQVVGKIFPSLWGNIIMTSSELKVKNVMPLVLMLFVSVVVCVIIMKRETYE